MQRKMDTKDLTTIAMLLALQILLTQVFSIKTPFLRISFAFLPISMCALLYGGIWGGTVAALADLIGAMFFLGSDIFLGFTLTAFLKGFIYGILFYKHKRSNLRVLAAVLIVTAFCELGLNTYWNVLMRGYGELAFLSTRAIKAVVMVPIQFALILTFWKLTESIDFVKVKKINS